MRLDLHHSSTYLAESDFKKKKTFELFSNPTKIMSPELEPNLYTWVWALGPSSPFHDTRLNTT